jgi:hypothetical protein
LAYGSRENWSSFSRWRAFHAPLFRVTVSYDSVFPRHIHFSLKDWLEPWSKQCEWFQPWHGAESSSAASFYSRRGGPVSLVFLMSLPGETYPGLFPLMLGIYMPGQEHQR